MPALNADYADTIHRRTPLVVLLIVGGTLLALAVGFRSVLVPLKAVALNLLTVGAALGVVVLVFQDGIGARLLGLAAPLDGVFAAVPLLVFCIVFGLSMDYEVFLLSRVAEARRRGASEGVALVTGVGRSGRVITSAASIMVVVFGAFALGDFVLVKILGVALAAAVVLDATLVRLAVGPALLALAGRWNWWPGSRSPRSARRRRSIQIGARERHVRRAVRQRLREQSLDQREPAALEAERGGGHVESPHAVGVLAHERHGLRCARSSRSTQWRRVRM